MLKKCNSCRKLRLQLCTHKISYWIITQSANASFAQSSHSIHSRATFQSDFVYISDVFKKDQE